MQNGKENNPQIPEHMRDLAMLYGEINMWALLYRMGRYHHECFYCETPLNKENRSTDRLVPIVRMNGALCHPENSIFGVFNTVRCCKACHELKSDLTITEFHTVLKYRHHDGIPNHLKETMIKNIEQVIPVA